ncbi:MAG: ATP-binding protein, partial [Lachnospiraceae bacterium]
LITNLVNNGIKYNHAGGSVTVRIIRQMQNMVIEVQDTGMGISEEEKDRIFERFYRVDKGRSKKMGGTGLGLSIVKHIVEYYNGTIELISTPGEGSIFLVTLPVLGEK